MVIDKLLLEYLIILLWNTLNKCDGFKFVLFLRCYLGFYCEWTSCHNAITVDKGVYVLDYATVLITYYDNETAVHQNGMHELFAC